MTPDIVERLRRWHIVTGDKLQLDAADEIEKLRHNDEVLKRHLSAAADEIERLRAELMTLRPRDESEPDAAYEARMEGFR